MSSVQPVKSAAYLAALASAAVVLAVAVRVIKVELGYLEWRRKGPMWL
jgi:hypothetical protein